MCGIFALLNNNGTVQYNCVEQAFITGQRRGPEESILKEISTNVIFGFHRLSINGLGVESGQPMTIGGITLICNGEIFNFKELFSNIKIVPKTSSDCEIIIHLYKLYGIEQTLRLLDGEFAFILYDNSDNTKTPLIHAARDPFGVRPLYYMDSIGHNKEQCNATVNALATPIIAFSSELKCLSPLVRTSNDSQVEYKIKQFIPGSFTTYELQHHQWKTKTNNKKYHSLNCSTNIFSRYIDSELYGDICFHLNKAVEKRVVGTTERPVACLLSGGLDSSLITALVNRYYKGQLETYSIGMEGSEDLRNARKVAEHLKTKHTEIILTKDDFFNAIPEVINAIESYDTTTVRASVGNYLIGKYISEHSDAKVIFNGDGSDELTGGYIYFLAAPDDIEFDNECRRLLSDIYAFDVLRSDKSISTNGLEPRTPFLDREWVQFYLNIPVSLRNPLNNSNNNKVEKYLLRKAFSEIEPGLIPNEILWRTKEAFSDGVSGNEGSWFEIINSKINELFNCYDGPPIIKHDNINVPTTNEQKYYRDIYDKLYPNTADIVPYFWMPKYVNAQDCSARTISFYNKSKVETDITRQIGSRKLTSNM